MLNKNQQSVPTTKDNDEQRAYDFLMMHYNRVVTFDEVNRKSIDRAGIVGKAIRDLLDALQLYSRVRGAIRK